MKKAVYSLFLLLLTSLFSSFSTGNCAVNYKGIYAIKLDDEHSAVLRFYEDGTVLASTSINDYMDVMTWFNKDNKDMVLKGKYKIKKCTISFDVSGMTGEQSYTGTIEDGKLNITLTDKESKKHATRTYTYYAL
ncbi:MAG: hypothetical protein JWP12_471 [Bacteroidetes bacterium]|nr:hypothetical protein [Bacteroidota bacterium]